MPRRRENDDGPNPVPTPRSIAASASLGPGTVVERFVLLDAIGAGGLGDVWSAHDPELDRKVALKFLRSRSGEAARDLARLLREAQAMARLQHPNVVTIFDVGTHRGQVFLAMELVHGCSLTQWLAQRARGWRAVFDVMVSAGRGLAASHAAGLVHRDFKPDNVMVAADGRVLVVDFGLAVTAEGQAPGLEVDAHTRLSQALTDDEVVMGTLPYMAPERFAGPDVGPASDQFSFCVSLHEALAGGRPFDGQTVAEHVTAVQAGPPPRGSLPGRVPRWLGDTVRRGLFADPARRFASMDDLLAALASGVQRRRRRRLGIGLAVVLAAGAGVIGGRALGPRPTAAELERLEQLATEAREAADRGRLLHPPSDSPSASTALGLVLELERVEGPAATRSAETAAQLRAEFAQRLVELAADYESQPGGEAFAADFYAAALVFDPEQSIAQQRCTLSPGQVQALRVEAERGDFDPRVLTTYDAHGVLAEADPRRRRDKVATLMARRGAMPDSTRQRVRALVGAPSTPDAASSAEHDDDASGRDVLPPTTAQQLDASGRDVLPPTAAQQLDASEPMGEAPDDATLPAEPDAAASDDPEDAQSLREPERARAAARAGSAELARGALAAAETHFHRALRHDRRNVEALVGLADVYFHRSEYPRAATYAAKAVRIAPGRASLHLKLGDAYAKALRYDDALEAYGKARRKGSRAAAQRIELVNAKLGR